LTHHKSTTHYYLLPSTSLHILYTTCRLTLTGRRTIARPLFCWREWLYCSLAFPSSVVPLVSYTPTLRHEVISAPPPLKRTSGSPSLDSSRPVYGELSTTCKRSYLTSHTYHCLLAGNLANSRAIASAIFLVSRRPGFETGRPDCSVPIKCRTSAARICQWPRPNKTRFP
jgi:hypothetical protein